MGCDKITVKIMKKILLEIQYDGTMYHGWQRQPNAVTIQEVIERALFRITGENNAVISSGRTDSGVHAIAQTAVFSTTVGLEAEIFRKALNSLLPGDIRITHAQDAPLDFHPRYDAKKKRYFYIISNSPVLSPFLRNYTWHIRQKIDADLITEASGYLIGTHDFMSFSCTGSDVKSTIREIFDIKTERGGIPLFPALSCDCIKIIIEANGFLRYMVRNIVGTLMDVARGRIAPMEIEYILSVKDRKAAGPTAPAKGLFLEKVFY